MDKQSIKMVMEQNELNGHWMCYISEVPSQMYAVPNKREAIKFVNNVNNAIANGELIYKDGTIVKAVSHD